MELSIDELRISALRGNQHEHVVGAETLAKVEEKVVVARTAPSTAVIGLGVHGTWVTMGG
jgi:hypothetical protein